MSSRASICLKTTTRGIVHFSVITTQTPLTYNITNKSPYTTDMLYGGVTVQVVCCLLVGVGIIVKAVEEIVTDFDCFILFLLLLLLLLFVCLFVYILYTKARLIFVY